MGNIKVLPDILASQVAAGEVVERPGSVVKELIENSIDAGATKITVEFKRGGTRLIRVSDNGRGMDSEDASLCLERHATSKIKSANDLSEITTLGFRGEALPSIASVSRFKLSSCLKGEQVGTEVIVEGGVTVSKNPTARTSGTTIEVSDVFYNIPARRKFLRTDQTESAQILSHIQNFAIAHPEITFVCIKDERELIRWPAADSHEARLSDVLTPEFTSNLKEVPPLELGGIKVRGWIARPGEGREDRTRQLIFVNGRIIRSPIISMPIKEASIGYLEKNLHPPAVLFFDMPPSFVDCNVHPAKLEVRFKNPSAIRTAAYTAARSAWTSICAPLRPDFPPTPAPQFSNDDFPLPPAPLEVLSPTISPKPLELPMEVKQTRFKFVGSVDSKYFVFEDAGAVVFVEHRAALERLTYERLLRETNLEASQSFLVPEVMNVSVSDHDWLLSKSTELKSVGVVIESFGQGSVKIDALPPSLLSVPAREILDSILTEVKGDQVFSSSPRESLARHTCSIVARREAIPTGEYSASSLIGKLLECSMPYSTPSGRPTMFQMSPADLTRKFQA